MISPRTSFVARYRTQLKRWNSQISLVSRQNTDQVIETLLHQSIAGFKAVVSNFVDKPEAGAVDNRVGNHVDNYNSGFLTAKYKEILYFDLGSGGGLPGFIWSHLLDQAHPRVRSFLVEPRKKRAWFLERVSREDPEVERHVVMDRWGNAEGGAFELSQRLLVLVSLKALNLDDSTVLGGLEKFLGEKPQGGDLVIARYYPPEQIIDAQLRRELGFPEAEESFSGQRSFSFCRSWIESVPPGGFPGASLVISQYKF